LGRLSVMRAGDRRWTAWLQMVVLVPANLIGAVVSFTYFNFVDPLAPGRDDVLAGSVLFFLFGFALLSGLVSVWANRWSRVLDPVDGRVPTGAAHSCFRTRWPASSSSPGRSPVCCSG
jgi:hypothetical protein